MSIWVGYKIEDFTWVIPLIRVDKPRVDGVYTGQCMQNTMDEPTRPGVASFALCFLSHVLEKFEKLFLVFQELRRKEH